MELYSFGSFIERLADRFTVIRYDKPGCGLSDRDGIGLSFDGQVAAALAVADAVGAGRFSLFRASQGAGVVRVCASGRDPAPAEVRNSVVALVRAYWGPGLKALAGAFVTDPAAEDVDGFARFQRASASAAVAARLLKAGPRSTSALGPHCRHRHNPAAIGHAWPNVEATLQAAAPSARPGCADR